MESLEHRQKSEAYQRDLGELVRMKLDKDVLASDYSDFMKLVCVKHEKTADKVIRDLYKLLDEMQAAYEYTDWGGGIGRQRRSMLFLLGCLT